MHFSGQSELKIKILTQEQIYGEDLMSLAQCISGLIYFYFLNTMIFLKLLGIFRLLVDDQSNRKIEIAFQGDVTVFTFDTDQEILDIILEGEENFIRVHQSENSVTISGNGISDENNDLFKSTPKGILMELLKAPKCTKGPEMANNLHSVFANSDIKSIISECNYDAEKETLVFKESTTGRCYVRKMQVMPAAIFQPTSVSAVAPDVEEKVVIKEVEKPVKSQPPTPKPAAALPKKEEPEEDDFSDDDDSDESQLYTSDESSESNDEGSDDPGYYGGRISEWKSSNRSSKKKKVKELR